MIKPFSLCFFWQGTSVLSPMLPIGIVIILAVMIWQKSTVHIFESHPCLYLLSFSMVAIKVTNRLIVSISLALKKVDSFKMSIKHFLKLIQVLVLLRRF